MRSTDLNDEYLTSVVAAATRELAALRRSEQPFGSRSVKKYRVFNPGSHDVEVTNIGFNNRVVEITFTPDDTTDTDLGGVLDFDYVLTYDPAGYVEAILEPLQPTNGVSKWRLYLSGNDSQPTAWARIKAFAFTNGAGTIQVALL